MNLNGKTTFFMILMAILWVLIVLMGWKGIWFPSMFLSLIIIGIHMMLGSAKKGILSKKLFVYPILSWFIVWALSFGLSKYHADMFAGRMPDFTILGFHPSFAWTIILYFIGGVLTISVGYRVLADEWLTKKEWEEFKDNIKKLNEERGGEYSDSRN
ncbi:hypothetical protein [Proteiniborus sp.]|uniref:hypothetical protein n=1 Tax=Proteiniborus sp. TaxID=2079015 RepID=UPI00332BAC35